MTFKYERLPIFCHYCGLLGHNLKHCTSHFATTKNGGEVICQYGDWLKASRGRPWSPSKHEPKRHGKAQTVQVMLDDNGQIEKKGVMTTGNTKHGANSNEHDKREEGKSKILGIYMGHEKRDKGNPEMIGMKSDSGDKRSESHRHTNMDMEALDMVWEDDTYPSLNSKAQNNVVESNLKRNSKVSCPSAEHVETQFRDGPRDSKNRPTWKRLTPMLCGPDVSKQYDESILGKRDVQEKEKEIGMDLEKQLRKCEKMEENSQKTIATGVMDHPC